MVDTFEVLVATKRNVKGGMKKFIPPCFLGKICVKMVNIERLGLTRSC